MNLTSLVSREVFGAWLNENELLGLGVEVGASNGVNAHDIISRWRGQRLTLVDTWGSHYPGNYRERTDWTAFDACKKECEKLQQDDPRIVLIQSKSLDAAGMFEDESLDFVYIDADHSFHAVIADSVAYWPKVKKGGVMGWHDSNYNDTVFPAYNEVKRALESWMPFMGLSPHITPKCGSAWVIKPEA